MYLREQKTADLSSALISLASQHGQRPDSRPSTQTVTPTPCGLQSPKLTLSPSKQQQGHQACDQGPQQQDKAATPAIGSQQQAGDGSSFQAGLQEIGQVEGRLKRGQAAQKAGLNAPANQPGREALLWVRLWLWESGTNVPTPCGRP